MGPKKYKFLAMNIFHLGIMCCGEVGNKLLLGASKDPSIEIVAVADLKEQAACETAIRHKVDRFYTNPDSLLADQRVEGVVLALPTTGRTDLDRTSTRLNSSHIPLF